MPTIPLVGRGPFILQIIGWFGFYRVSGDRVQTRVKRLVVKTEFNFILHFKKCHILNDCPQMTSATTVSVQPPLYQQKSYMDLPEPTLCQQKSHGSNPISPTVHFKYNLFGASQLYIKIWYTI